MLSLGRLLKSHWSSVYNGSPKKLGSDTMKGVAKKKKKKKKILKKISVIQI